MPTKTLFSDYLQMVHIENFNHQLRHRYDHDVNNFVFRQRLCFWTHGLIEQDVGLSTFNEICCNSLRIIICWADVSPKNLSAVAIYTALGREAEQFKFIVTTHVPHKVWTSRCIHASFQFI